METIIINILITLVVIFSLIYGEIGALALPRLSRHFNRRPFSCRHCLTFWLHLSGMMIISLAFQNWRIALSGVLTAFIVFLTVRYLDKQKVVL